MRVVILRVLTWGTVGLSVASALLLAAEEWADDHRPLRPFSASPTLSTLLPADATAAGLPRGTVAVKPAAGELVSER